MFLAIFFALLFLISTTLLVVSIKKLMAFDDLVELLQHDIETNIKHLETYTSSAVLSNSDEVQTLTKSMNIMKARLNEFIERFSELRNTRTSIAVKQSSNKNKPIVVD